MAALAGDAVAQLFKNADGVTLADPWNFWHNSNGDECPGVTRPIRFRLPPDILLSDFEPELNGFPDVGQRFFARRPLAMAARQGGTGNGKPFVRFNHDHMILHDDKIP
jgi:hypothetical protein